MVSLDSRQVAVLVLGAIVISSSLIGVGIDRGIRFDSLSVSVLVSTGPTFRLPRGTTLVFYPGFDQNVNVSEYRRFDSADNASLTRYVEGGVELSLPNLKNDDLQVVRISGIPFPTGLQVTNENWIPPVYYASVIQNLSVTLDGVVTCSTPVGIVPCESYTLYYGENPNGYNDYRGYEGAVNLIMFASLGAIIGGILLSLRRRRLVEFVPFATLAIVCVSSFLYVYSDFSVVQAGISPATQLWTRLLLPFTHSGFNHYFGNLPYFVILGTSIELASRYDRAKFPFGLSFVAPFLVYYVTSIVPGGYGLSTLIGSMAAGLWAYFYVLHWASGKQTSGETPRLGTGRVIVLGVASGLASTSVILGWALTVGIWGPFNSAFTDSEGVWHLAVAGISGLTSYLLWKAWFDSIQGFRVNRVVRWLVGGRRNQNLRQWTPALEGLDREMARGEERSGH